MSMFLKSVHIKRYKSIADSGVVEFDRQVSCLVGKNESGKTAFLEALYRLNPLPMGHCEKFDGLRDYPRRTYTRDRESVPGTIVIETTFTLEPEDVSEVEGVYGGRVLSGTDVLTCKNYDNKRIWTLPINEQQLVENLVASAGVDPGLALDISSVQELVKKLKAQIDPPEAVSSFLREVEGKNYRQEIQNILEKQLPKFLYFDQYNIMPGRVSIQRLQTAENQLQPGERTALSLLRLAGVQAQEFTESKYEARKAALEAAANQLTDEVFEYWSQNKDLSIELDVDFKSPADQNGQPPFLDIRVRNQRHRVTLNFGDRSHGFMWFFSFLAAFSEYRRHDNMILLFDEPGLGLHAAAQGDLLRLIDERLATEHQVAYTTHSPFMVEATRLQRVRTVEDVDEEGTKVSADVLSTSKDTRFPLQAALGYDLAQTLFLGPDNLVVEGPADYLYLQVMSGYLQGMGRTGLDPRWVIVPVGGLDKIPTFIALLGAQLNVAVVLEVAAGGTQKVNSLVQRGIIAGEKLIPLTEFTHTAEADIEDLFDASFYLDLLDRTGIATVKRSELKTAGRIVKRVEAVSGASFDHYQPARYLLEHQVELLKGVDKATLDRFEELFSRANQLVGSVTNNSIQGTAPRAAADAGR
jgi:predicted ATP-dependent endonuclease of OLD family